MPQWEQIIGGLKCSWAPNPLRIPKYTKSSFSSFAEFPFVTRFLHQSSLKQFESVWISPVLCPASISFVLITCYTIYTLMQTFTVFCLFRSISFLFSFPTCWELRYALKSVEFWRPSSKAIWHFILALVSKICCQNWQFHTFAGYISNRLLWFHKLFIFFFVASKAFLWYNFQENSDTTLSIRFEYPVLNELKFSKKLHITERAHFHCSVG